MKQDTWNDMKRINVNVDQTQVFVTKGNGEIKINAGVNAQN